MGWIFGIAFVAVNLALSAAQPVDKLPVLKLAPHVMPYVVSETSPYPLQLECATTTPIQGVKYSWHKNGQPFNWQSVPDVTQRPNEGSLEFSKPKDDAEGLYQCFAETSAGIASTRIINVKKSYINAPKVAVVKHKPVEGKPFKLDCKMPDAYPKPTIVWQKQSVDKPEKSETLLDKRIVFSPDGTLWFSNVTKEDVDPKQKYVCLAKQVFVTGLVPLAEHIIEGLEENKGPKDGELTAQYLSQDFTTKVGDITDIYCVYGGTPLAHPDWFKDGKNVNNKPGDRVTRHNRSAGRRLRIKDTNLGDQGTYTCIANNEVGKPQNHTIHLTVVSIPEFSKNPEPQQVAKDGQDVTIPCQVKGVPAPKITWTYNAKPLKESDRISINTAGSSSTIAVADLIIKKVQKSDKGYYGCRGVNDNGDVYKETLLTV